MAVKRKADGRHWFEITGIILAGISVFLICCMVSYHPEDPSFETGLSGVPAKINNWGKLLGAWLSSFLFQVLGLGAFAVPASMLLMALKLLFRPAFTAAFYVRTALYGLLFLCVETLLSLWPGRLELALYRFDAGGALVGGLLAAGMKGTIGLLGTYLLIVMIMLLIIMGLTKVSYVLLWHRLVELCRERVLAPALRQVKRLKKTAAQRLLDSKRKSSPPAASRTGPLPEAPALEQPLPAEILSAPETVPGDIPISIYREKEHGSHDSEDERFEAVSNGLRIKYSLPTLSLLDQVAGSSVEVDRELLRDDAEVLMQKLSDFGVRGRIVEISPGPVITRFEFEPASGIKLNRIVGLSEDLALALKAMSVRIAPIPGKSVVGIELPSKKRKTVYFREIVSRKEFQEARSRLTVGLGKDIAGGTIINDLSRMPHLLVAGTTGSGKSVFINTVICSILFKATPAEVRFLMIDPKRLELFPYDGIPHLLHPVVVNPKKAAVALRWAVEEMDRRYRMLADMGTRDIVQYNKKIEREIEKGLDASMLPAKMTYIVVVIDELADLMMIAARDVEQYIARLAQMARASGIHLLVATQRPSVDILTGVIKANFPSRISFQVSSKVDSRTILDTMGAEKLLGMGDMLVIPPGTSRLQRIHGAYISEREINRVAEFIKKQGSPTYDESIAEIKEADEAAAEEEEYDELYDKAVALVTDTRQASISSLQRRMRVGYNRAARMIERMEREGVVGPSDGVKPRDVLANKL